jgi:hypothetical protein
METSIPPLDPRLSGIAEQIERSLMFFHEALAFTDLPGRFRRLIASMYFARSVVEIMIEAADRQIVNISRAELEKKLAPLLPHYHLVEKIRIDDFHRFGIVPTTGLVLNGPIKLTANNGSAVFTVPLTPGEGRTHTTTGRSKVQEQRPLQMVGDRFFDEETNSYFTLDVILKNFLAGVPGALQEFVNHLVQPNPPAQEVDAMSS